MNPRDKLDASWRLVCDGIRDGDLRLLLGVVVVLGIAFAAYSVRRQVRRIGIRFGLVALRAGAILLAALWLLEPTLVHREVSKIQSIVPVLIDVSDSMNLADGDADGKTRAAVTAALVAEDAPLAAALAADGDRRLLPYGFAEALTPGYDPLAESAGADSAPGAALQAAVAAHRGQPVAGIVVVTDGRRTAGISAAVAAAAAHDAGIPVSVITIGTAGGPKSLLLTDLAAPERTLAKEAFTLDATIRANGLRDGAATLILEQRTSTDNDWQTIESRTLAFDKDVVAIRESFTHTLDQVGKLHLRVRLADGSVEAGAPLVQTVDVMPERLRVLLIAGSTFPEVQFLRTALIRDDRITVASWLLDADRRYRNPGNITLDSLPADMDSLNQWDCVVLYDPDPDRWPADFGALLYRFVAERGGGLVYVAGAQRSATLLDDATAADPRNNWLSLLPVVREPGEFRADLAGMLDRDRAWPLQLTREGYESELFRFAEDAADNRGVVERLPGMYWHLPVTRPRAGAVVLARHADERMRNRHGGHVLVATQLFGPGRTWFVGVDSLYRWRYLGEDVYAGFWARMITSAARGRMLGGGPIRLTVSPDPAPGVPLQIRAAYRSADDRPSGGAPLPAVIEDPQGNQYPLTLEPIVGQDGEFAAVFTPDKPGAWFARVGANGESFVAAANEKFQVRQPERERRDPTADPEFAEIVAGRTGGRVATPTNAAGVADAFSMRRVDHVREDRTPLWDHPLFYGLFFLLLFGEWLWRKALRLP